MGQPTKPEVSASWEGDPSMWSFAQRRSDAYWHRHPQVAPRESVKEVPHNTFKVSQQGQVVQHLGGPDKKKLKTSHTS